MALPQGSGFPLYLLQKSKRMSLQSLTQTKTSQVLKPVRSQKRLVN